VAAVRWTRSPNLIGAEIRSRKERVRAGLVDLAGSHGARVESNSKQNARWQDRTGAARAGIGHQVSTTSDAIEIVVFHSVSYGVFLETGTSKMPRYGVMVEEAEKTAAELAADAGELVRRLFAS
jgi:hypothetical protein